MADLLANLAARTLHAAPLFEPRPRTRFEPLERGTLDIPAVVNEEMAAPTARALPPAPPERSTVMHLESRHIIERALTPPALVPPPLHIETPPAPLPFVARLAREPEAVMPEIPVAPQAAATPPAPARVPERLESVTAEPPRPRETTSVAPPPVTVTTRIIERATDLLPAAPPLSSASMPVLAPIPPAPVAPLGLFAPPVASAPRHAVMATPSAAEAPTIQVTIGRVYVRANIPPPSSSRAPPPGGNKHVGYLPTPGEIVSNHLAIAATTATLGAILSQQVGVGVSVSPLDVAAKKIENDHLNLFLYQTSLDAAWRNQPLPGVKSGESGHAPLPLCLYFMLTAYSNEEDELEAQRLLGHAMNVLHDHPLLTAEEIRQATQTNVAGSNLHEQVERVRITPQPLNVEEMSKLWAAFQTNYRLSVAYQAAVVLIESERATRTPLPVLSRGKEDRGPVATGSLIPPYPTIDAIVLPNGQTDVLLNDVVELRGHHFALDTNDPALVSVTVQFITSRLQDPIRAVIAPADHSDQFIKVTIPHQNGVFYPAGFYRVSAELAPTSDPSDVHVTNDATLTLAPRLTGINGTTPLPAPPNAPVSAGRTNIVGDVGDVTLTVTCEPEVLPEQRCYLLVGDRQVLADEHTTQTDTLTFEATKIRAGTYRMRLRVDGVESPLVDRSNPQQPKFDDSQRVTLT